MSSEAIAVVGMSCRLPGHVTDPATAWDAAVAGVDAIRPVPPERWGPQGPTVSGRPVPDAGGFLDRVDGFDAEFFGISPREAKSMDPGQRLLLELAVEALEDGRAAPHAQRGRPVGVYVGMGLSDYGRRHFLGDCRERIDAWSGTGTLSSVASGRIAYHLGLTGPALSVHTACSSSLVAVHLAVQALRSGQVEAALAGGVNLLLAPEPTVYFAELQALSPTGRCRSFDAEADGYVRGEGGALLMLRRLDDARRDGDRILAVIRGTAVNQDGRSNGLTAPSGRAQEQVIRAALADADLSPEAVGMVEAHGTGTPLGDPIELAALSRVYGAGEAPCRVVSAKSRIGHLEAAAGAAGMVQAVLAVAHARVPPHLHLTSLNPRVSLEGTRLQIPTHDTPWMGHRVAGVSSFGLSGTNAHVIVEQPPAVEVTAAPPAAEQLVALSAHSPAALRQRLEQLRVALRDGQPLASVAAAASVGRQAHRHRAVAVVDGDELPDLQHGSARRAPEVVFAFTGQGSQRPGMARQLLADEPVFREAFDRCDAVWRAAGEPSLHELIATDPDHTRLHDTEVTQPALFAVGWGLAALWRSWGVEPAAVLGHSVGEITAAAVAGVMTPEDGMRLVIARGRALGALPRDGAMVAVGAGPDVVLEVLDALQLPVDIAALNAPDESVISGERGAVLQALTRFEERGVRATELRVSHAFHSPLVEPAQGPFADAVRGLDLRQPTLPLYSALSGRLADGSVAKLDTWVQHIRATVRFADAVRAAVADGLSVFVECGPRPVLSGAGARTAPSSTWTGGLHPDTSDRRRLLQGLGALFLRGLDPQWRAVHRGVVPGRLPPYPFQRTRHWMDPLPPRGEVAATLPLRRIDWVRAAGGSEELEGSWVVVGNPGGLGGALQSRLHDLGLDAHCSPSVSRRQRRQVVAFVPPGLDGMVRVAELLAEPRVERLFAVVIGDADDPEVAMLEGLAAGAAVEHPDRFRAMVRVEPDLPSAAVVDGLVGVLRDPAGDDRVALDAGGARVPRLADLPPVMAAPPALDAEAAYLITGGLGRIGLAVAGLLVDLGARHLLLVSRRGLAGDEPGRAWVRDAVRALEARGVTVRVEAADVSDVDALHDLQRAGQRRIRGVVHAAGVSGQGALEGRSREELERPLRAKLQGARAVHRALRGAELDFVLLLSSVAAVWGAPGLAAYGAANATLHALARSWRAEGWPATAVAMGPWAVGGMVSEGELDDFRRLGVTPMATDAAVAALARLLGAHTPPVVCLADLALDTFVPLVSARRRRPLFHRLLQDDPPAPTAPAHVGWLAELHDTEADARYDHLRDLLRGEVAAVLGLDPDAPVDPEQGFFDLGMDSVMAVEAAERLRGALGRPLPATVVFDHPNLNALSSWLLAELELTSAEVAPVEVVGPVDEPIAVVGMGCRFPGAASPEAYWELLHDGVDAVGPVPYDRWDSEAWYDPTPATPGRTVARTGGFLDPDVHDLTQFEPDFFGISPREADALDPQQRLLMEVAWEALERAGIAPDSLAGSATGVFVGIGRSEYWDRLRDPSAAEGSDSYPWGGTGNESSFAAGRLSHTLGLRGPAMAVNTACSSSLVAAHLAVRALRSGEASLALAAGVNVLLSPESMVYLSQIRALSPSGRCRTFDAQADGYVRGEGCGVVVLERLSDARAHGRKILGLVRGSAVGHDGAASGLTVPSSAAQQDVMRRALHDAGVSAASVGVLEAHGTGTSLGDPIELGAVRSVYGPDRTAPLMVGSVKTQIGHLETAAGVAGLIKLVLALQHGQVPGTLHLHELNPALPLDFPVHIPTRVEPWGAGARRAAVSSFGISGTNAHLIVEQAPSAPDEARQLVPEGPQQLLAVSAHTPEALTTVVKGVRRALREHPPAAVAATLVHGRATRQVRVAVVGETGDRLRKRLRSPRHQGTVEAGRRPRVAWVFTGQGSQQPAMAADLYRDDAVFREALDAALREVVALPVRLRADDLRRVLLTDDDRIHDTRFTQPALVAYGWALAERWRALGLRPDVVFGHSVGEITAAAVASVLSLSDALRLAAERGRLMSELPGGGRMVAALTHEEQVRSLVHEVDGVSIAAVNGPEETVVSGFADGVAAVWDALEHAGVELRELTVSHAFHSPAMEPILTALGEVASQLTHRPPRIPLVRGLDGELAESLSPDDWVHHAREAVRFRDALHTLVERGVDTLLEVGPRPVLSAMALRQQALEAVPSAEPRTDGRTALLEAAAALWVRGAPVDLDTLYPPAPPVPLPTTPWQRRRCWIEAPEIATAAQAVRLPLYERTWVDAPAPEHPPGGRVAVVSLELGLGSELVDELVGLGCDAFYADLGDDLTGVDHVVAFHGVDPERTGPRDPTHAALVVLRALLSMPAPRPRLWWVSRGAVAVRPGEPVDAPQTAVWGLLATAWLEHPDLLGGMVDLDPDDDASGLAEALACGEPQAALWSGRALVPRIRPWAPAAPVAAPEGTWLVTGGAGAIGRHVVAWLLDKGVDHVLVVGRSQPSEECEELWGDGPWSFMAADVGDRDQVLSVLQHLRDQPTPPLTGVVHTAGARGDGLLRSVTGADLKQTWRAKVRGAWHLHQLTSSLSAFVMFSSAVGWFGRPGQGAYGAANAFLDGLAQVRRARGMPGTSLAWGPWADTGMAESVDDEAWEGAAPMSIPTALAALEAALSPDAPAALAPFPVDWETFARRWPEGPPAALSGLPGVTAASASPGSASALVRRLRRAAPGDREAMLVQVVGDAARKVLGRDEPLGDHRGFFDAGMDSLMAVQLARHLTGKLDLPVPATVAFDHPDVASLAHWLLQELHLAAAEPGEVVVVDRDEPIAVVGMACRFPGADSPEALWQLVLDGRVAIDEVPADRWDADHWLGAPGEVGRIYATRGGFIDEVDQFDPDFFGISAREAASLDPQQRLLLEVCVHALERAGHGRDDLRGSRTGVFVGIKDAHYLRRFQAPGETLYPDPWSGTGAEPSFAAGRVAHALGLHGPTLALNTTCSSSLVALHLASHALMSGECDRALAGGVSLQLHPDDTAYLCQLGALSPTGACHVFDASADGYVRSEGCGVLVLRRLGDALRDGDRVLAVVKGSAVNHDGPSSGLTVPNGEAQEKVLREALAHAGVRPRDVGYLEAHGTGTRLGDPIEVRAALQVYGDRKGSAPLALGAIKANIGHAELAAGAASLIKTICALQAGRIPPQVGVTEVNPALDLSGATLPSRPQPWPDEARLAAVSGFGLSGTNAHIVLAPPPAAPATVEPPAPPALHWVPLSAASPASLTRLAAELDLSQPLVDLAHTLQLRSPLPVRRAVVAADRAELAAALRALPAGRVCAGRPRVALLFSGQGSQHGGMVRGLAGVSPVVRDTLDVAAEVLDPLLQRPLAELLDDDDALRDTAVTQPVLLAVEVAVARQWLAWGLEPVALLGHSLGELAAAVVADVFTLEEGLRLAAERGRLMAAQPPGAMAAVRGGEAAVQAALASGPEGVEIAAVNHDEEVVIAGPEEAVRAVVAQLAEGDDPLEARSLAVSHAFHSAMLEPMLDPWAEAVAAAKPQPPSRRILSLLTGSEEQESLAQPAFWRRHAREPVRAAVALRALGELGVDLVLDVGPHPTLMGLAARVLPEVGGVGSLRRGRAPDRQLLEAASELFQAGVRLRDVGPRAGRAELPPYPFDRRRFWLEEPSPPTADWVYGMVWEALVAREGPLPQRVHVLGDDKALVARSLHQHGVAVVPLGDGAEADADWLIDLRPLGEGSVTDHVVRTVRGVTRPGRARRIVVTRGGSEAGVEPVGHAVGALVRTLQLECREQAPVWLDLAPSATPEGIARALRAVDDEDQLHVDGIGVTVPRLARRRVPDRAAEVSGCWLITGGLGALGLAVARWLVHHGVDKLVLTARTPLPPREGWGQVGDPILAGRVAAVQALEAQGATVVPVAADVTDEESMAEIVRAHVPDGVVHAAGITLPQAADAIDRETVQRTLAAKVEGARLLDRLTAQLELQGFVLFSSIAAVWGSVDLAAYSAANGFLDGLAAKRRSEGRPATSIAWGPWGGGGMVDAERAARLERAGQHLLPPDQATAVMGALLRSRHPHAVVARVDWPRFLAVMEAAGPRPMLSTFRSLVPEPLASPATPVAVVRSWTEGTLTDEVTTQARQVLRLADDRPLAPVTPLMELGFDSLMATELKRALDELGIDVPLGRLLGGPSVEEIVSMAVARQGVAEVAPSAGGDDVRAVDEADDEGAFPAHLVWSHAAAVIVGVALAAAVAGLLF